MKERDFIEKITGQFKYHQPLLTKGIGDDCAVIEAGDDECYLLSTDLLVENIHFSLKWHSPYLLGRKSLAVNLSDIAAMGGKPLFILLSIAVPSHVDDLWLEKWTKGVSDIAKQFNCVIIGGDTTKGEKLSINVVAIGVSPREKIIYRGGASPEEDIYVTGLLGGSSAGLEVLSKNLQRAGDFSQLISTHLDPKPMVAEGLCLSTNMLATAMQDISDGLSTDLSHICKASSVAGEIFYNLLPFDEKLHKIATLTSKKLEYYTLKGGEDYKLVFTSPAANRKKLKELFRKSSFFLFRVGKTKAGSGVQLVYPGGIKKDITFEGFEHYSKA